MTPQSITLVIYGLRTYLGREVARFGRSMGHRIVASVDRVPELDAPWMHGIHWATDDPLITPGSFPSPLRAVIYCDTALWNGRQHRFETRLWRRPRRILDRIRAIDPAPRFVYRSTTDQPLLSSGFTTTARRMESELARASIPVSILRFPLLYGPDRPDSVAAMTIVEALRRLLPAGLCPRLPHTLRVETAAMATLRAALEPDRSGVFEPPDIERIGDVMIPQ